MKKGTAKGAAKDAPKYFTVRENPMFGPEMTAIVRGVELPEKMACACCGKLIKKGWTMVVPFQSAIFGKYVGVMKSEPEVQAPLTAVCDDHPINPAEHPLYREVIIALRYFAHLAGGTAR